MTSAVEHHSVVHHAGPLASESNNVSVQFTTDLPHGEGNIDLCALLGGYDPDPMAQPPGGEANQMAWGFHVPTARGAWFQHDGGDTLTYVETKGDAVPSAR